MQVLFNNKGLTLAEVMVAMAIVIILAAFSVPAVREAAPNYRLRSLSYEILASAQRAKGLAVQENADIDLCFFADRFEVQTDNVGGDCDEGSAEAITPIVQRPYSDYGNSRQGFTALVPGCGSATENWNGDSNPAVANSISFSARGTASAGSVYLENGEAVGDNNLCYSITSITTGSVKLRKYLPCVLADQTCWVE